MSLAKTFSFILGLLTGIVLFWWLQVGGIAPPAPQETTLRELPYSNLKDEDKWLLDSKAFLLPLANVRSSRKYAVLIFTPSIKGVTPSSNRICWLYLKEKDYIQPIEISSNDFGPKGDQTAVKFIDEGAVFQEEYASTSDLILSGQE